MKLTSNSFKDGCDVGAEHILSADHRSGCAGGNRSPHLPGRRTGGDDELCRAVRRLAPVHCRAKTNAKRLSHRTR